MRVKSDMFRHYNYTWELFNFKIEISRRKCLFFCTRQQDVYTTFISAIITQHFDELNARVFAFIILPSHKMILYLFHVVSCLRCKMKTDSKTLYSLERTLLNSVAGVKSFGNIVRGPLKVSKLSYSIHRIHVDCSVHLCNVNFEIYN